MDKHRIYLFPPTQPCCVLLSCCDDSADFFQTGELEKYDFGFLFPILWLIGLPVFMTTCFIMGTLPLKFLMLNGSFVPREAVFF